MKKQMLNIHNDYLRLLVDTATTFGVPKSEVLRYCQIPLSLLAENNNHERISFSQWTDIIIRLIELLPDKGIGYQFGLNCKLTVHGALGFILISNSTIGKVLIDLQKYYSMRIHKMDLSVLNKNNKIIIRFNPLYQLPTHLNESKKNSVNKFFIESAIVDIINNLQMITNFNLSGVNIHVTWDKEDYHALYEKRLPIFHFSQDYNQISFDLKCLDLPLTFSSNSAYQLAMEMVNKEYLFYQDQDNKIILKVNQQLKFTPGLGFPSLTDVADKLKISERTLKRELALANTTFSALLQTRKFELAKKLIDSNRNIQEISDLLGYSHISAFSRAFFGWTGKKPSDYIREQRVSIRNYYMDKSKKLYK
ncbi:AraC family transcriptional regulator [Acinetobacter proteolyticus]|uniref:AraC family transcriptional regulator n=1 Tax=Acinetobacter proteolyticus TaxID=1776741 RepID=A0A653K5G5_9GAMM|nr:AraC family transcriptional regulator [Acinetobacter proteolyticus]VXA56103.1 AraC family transcriptional regulator [Acinetobacter proteolyticus]